MDKMEETAEAHADFIKRWYKDVFMHGFKHGVESVAPPSPPAEMPEVQPPECRDCDLGDDENWPCQWYDQEKKRCGHPEEPTPERMSCPKFPKAIGKKPPNSCVGCTIPGCKAKGKLELVRDFERDEPEAVEKDS